MSDITHQGYDLNLEFIVADPRIESPVEDAMSIYIRDKKELAAKSSSKEAARSFLIGMYKDRDEKIKYYLIVPESTGELVSYTSLSELCNEYKITTARNLRVEFIGHGTPSTYHCVGDNYKKGSGAESSECFKLSDLQQILFQVIKQAEVPAEGDVHVILPACYSGSNAFANDDAVEENYCTELLQQFFTDISEELQPVITVQGFTNLLEETDDEKIYHSMLQKDMDSVWKGSGQRPLIFGYEIAAKDMLFVEYGVIICQANKMPLANSQAAVKQKENVVSNFIQLFNSVLQSCSHNEKDSEILENIIIELASNREITTIEGAKDFCNKLVLEKELSPEVKSAIKTKFSNIMEPIFLMATTIEEKLKLANIIRIKGEIERLVSGDAKVANINNFLKARDLMLLLLTQCESFDPAKIDEEIKVLLVHFWLDEGSGFSHINGVKVAEARQNCLQRILTDKVMFSLYFEDFDVFQRCLQEIEPIKAKSILRDILSRAISREQNVAAMSRLVGFIKEKYDPMLNSYIKGDKTPLMLAVQLQDTEAAAAMVKVLLDAGCDPKIKDEECKTALDLARECSNEKVFEVANNSSLERYVASVKVDDRKSVSFDTSRKQGSTLGTSSQISPIKPDRTNKK